jgi:hypothetical protein
VIKREEWLRVSMKLELCNNRRNGNALNKSRKTVHDSTVYCNFNMALISITVAQCSLALFQNKAKRASTIYNVRFTENHISHDIIELTPSSVMVYQNERVVY